MKKGKDKRSKPQIDWHSGFAGGLELLFRDYKNQLSIEREHLLSKQPTRIDFLLIKATPGTIIDNDIGRLFKTHNIIEYKNPYDELNIDVIWKVIGYAALYKGLSHRKNAIPSSELSITVFRHSKPLSLFSQLKKDGYEVNNPHPGVYSVRGLVSIPVYVVVTKELAGDAFRVLRIMSQNANYSDIKAFIAEAAGYKTPGDRSNADAVLQVSSTANRKLFEFMKGADKNMSETLREIMADELKQAKETGASEMKAKLTIIIDEKDKTIAEKEALLKQYREKYGDL